jgi:hypothetical protein
VTASVRCGDRVHGQGVALVLLLGFMMLCDVISAVTESMVRVLHSMMLLGFMALCDGISSVR